MVGIDADPAQCIVFEQGGLLGQAHQDLPFCGGPCRTRALHQQPADPVFQCLDALADGRRRHMQHRRCTLEAAFAYHRAECPKLSVVQTHALALLNLVNQV